jgi:large subunit ribosomal protein L35
MPKLKTKKAAVKRFKITKTGKVLKKQPNVSHILTKKSRKRKRQLRGMAVLNKTEEKRIRRSMPYH